MPRIGAIKMLAVLVFLFESLCVAGCWVYTQYTANSPLTVWCRAVHTCGVGAAGARVGTRHRPELID